MPKLLKISPVLPIMLDELLKALPAFIAISSKKVNGLVSKPGYRLGAPPFGLPPLTNLCTDPPLLKPKALVAFSLSIKLPTGKLVGILSLVPLPGPLNTLIPPELNRPIPFLSA